MTKCFTLIGLGLHIPIEVFIWSILILLEAFKQIIIEISGCTNGVFKINASSC